jgi:hypothetical protein
VVAEHEHGLVGLDEGVRDGLDLVRVAGAGVRDRPQRLRLGVRLAQHHVRGQREEHRARRLGERDAERPAEHRGQRLYGQHLVRPLAELLDHLLEVARQDRLLVTEVPLVVARGHHERRPRHLRGVDVAEAVSEPRGDVEVDDARGGDRVVVVAVVPAGAGVARGHPDRDVLVEAENVLELGVRDGVDDGELRRPRVAEHVTHAVPLQRVHEQVGARVLAHTGGGAAIRM